MRILLNLLTAISILVFAACSDNLGVCRGTPGGNEVQAPDVNALLLPPETPLRSSPGVSHKLYPGFLIREEPEVEKFERLYSGPRRRHVEDAVLRGRNYRAMLGNILRYYGLPPELMAVVVVESRFCPKAKSRRGALGLWQFTRATGRAYGLRVSWFRDERSDPLKSTIAAARYLSSLYDRFNDWALVLAAYNGGPGAVARAMRKAKSDDFFEISRSGFLRRETRDFVAKVMAVAKIMKDPERYGFEKG